jgi:hypothetical protein
MFLRSKVSLVRNGVRKSELSAGENEGFTRFSSAKVSILRLKVRSLRLFRMVKPR